MKELEIARSLVRRLVASIERESWEEGETMEEAKSAAREELYFWDFPNGDEHEVIPASEVVDPFEGRETRRRLGCLCGSTDEDITHEVIYIFNDDAYFEMCRRCRTKKPPCTSIVATRPKGKTGAGVVTLWVKTIVADEITKDQP